MSDPESGPEPTPHEYRRECAVYWSIRLGFDYRHIGTGKRYYLAKFAVPESEKDAEVFVREHGHMELYQYRAPDFLRYFEAVSGPDAVTT